MSKVKLRYVELPPSQIFNWLDPFNVTCWYNMKDKHYIWWKPEIVELRKEWAKHWTQAFDDITGHFSLLRDSIITNGIKNPLYVISRRTNQKEINQKWIKGNRIPPEIQQQENFLTTFWFGGSRLTLANELKLEKVPCVIHDIANIFPNEIEVTRKNYGSWFSPMEYAFRDGQAPEIVVKTHMHMPKGKYSNHSSAAKQAQLEASKIANRKLNV